MRATISTLLGAGLVTVGCSAPPPTGPRPPITLQANDTVSTAAVAGVTPLNLGPTLLAMTMLSGPSSPWAAGFTHMADAAAWSHFGWGNLAGSLGLGGTGQATAPEPTGGSWSSLSGLTNGGLGTAIPSVRGWDPRRAWATPTPGTIGGMGAGGLGAMESPPGWGNKTWGPTGSGQGTSTWGQSTKPGMFNLARGAAEVSGWGMDTGFFTIPQEEKRRQMDSYLHQIDASPKGVPGAGQTRLDQSKFPFLRPIKGPLTAPK